MNAAPPNNDYYRMSHSGHGPKHSGPIPDRGLARTRSKVLSFKVTAAGTVGVCRFMPYRSAIIPSHARWPVLRRAVCPRARLFESLDAPSMPVYSKRKCNFESRDALLCSMRKRKP